MTTISIAEEQNYKVLEMRADDVGRWDAFVESSPDGTFFHLSGWKEIIQSSLGHPTTYLYCERNGSIVAVLPMAQVKSLLFGNALISLPFLVYGGVVSNDSRAEKLLVEAACKKARTIGADHLELRNKVASGRGWPTKDIYATFSKRMDPDPAKNLLAIPRKQRAMIRKGIKAGLKAEIDSNAGRLYEAMLACKRNLGTPFFRQQYLQDIFDTFGDKVEIMTVTKNGNVVCSVMSF